MRKVLLAVPQIVADSFLTYFFFILFLATLLSGFNLDRFFEYLRFQYEQHFDLSNSGESLKVAFSVIIPVLAMLYFARRYRKDYKIISIFACAAGALFVFISTAILSGIVSGEESLGFALLTALITFYYIAVNIFLAIYYHFKR